MPVKLVFHVGFAGDEEAQRKQMSEFMTAVVHAGGKIESATFEMGELSNSSIDVSNDKAQGDETFVSIYIGQHWEIMLARSDAWMLLTQMMNALMPEVTYKPGKYVREEEAKCRKE